MRVRICGDEVWPAIFFAIVSCKRWFMASDAIGRFDRIVSKILVAGFGNGSIICFITAGLVTVPVDACIIQQ